MGLDSKLKDLTPEKTLTKQAANKFLNRRIKKLHHLKGPKNLNATKHTRYQVEDFDPNNPNVDASDPNVKSIIDLREDRYRSNTILQLSVVSLLDSGLSPKSIAQHVGISEKTIEEMAKDKGLRGVLVESTSPIKNNLPRLLYSLAFLSTSTIKLEEIQKLSPLQRITMSAIAIDKARLMEGLSTDNISIRDVVPRIVDKIKGYEQAYSHIVDLIKQKNGDYEMPQDQGN